MADSLEGIRVQLVALRNNRLQRACANRSHQQMEQAGEPECESAETGSERTFSLLLESENCLPCVGGFVLQGRVGVGCGDTGRSDLVLERRLDRHEDGGLCGRVVDRHLCDVGEASALCA